MSADTAPISPTRFAAALKDLSLPTLHLKVLEIRNSILHLEYSNAQLRPYAEGAATTLDAADAAAGRPDPDCVEAIRENDAVVARMRERVDIIRAEVEGRGHGWDEFKSKDEVEAEAEQRSGGVNGTTTATTTTTTTTTNGLGAAREEEDRVANGGEAAERHPAWLDGTFQTGTIRNGEIQLDAQAGQRANGARANGTGGRLTDEELRRAMEERMRGLGQDDEEDDGGMHL